MRAHGTMRGAINAVVALSKRESQCVFARWLPKMLAKFALSILTWQVHFDFCLSRIDARMASEYDTNSCLGMGTILHSKRSQRVLLNSLCGFRLHAAVAWVRGD